MRKEKWWKAVLSDWGNSPLFYIGVAFVGAVVCLFGVLVYILYQKYPISDGGHLAAWVQAFGSVGAVVVAVFVVFYQENSLKKRTVREQAARERAFDLKVEEALYSLHSLSWYGEEGRSTSDPESVGIYLQLIREFCSRVDLLESISGLDGSYFSSQEKWGELLMIFKHSASVMRRIEQVESWVPENLKLYADLLSSQSKLAEKVFWDTHTKTTQRI